MSNPRTVRILGLPLRRARLLGNLIGVVVGLLVSSWVAQLPWQAAALIAGGFVVMGLGLAVAMPARRRAGKQVLIHLGGNTNRVFTTRRAAHVLHPDVVLVSAELDPRYILANLIAPPLPPGFVPEVEFDFRPWDTVTHFTAIADALEREGVRVLHVVTDRFHLRRALWVARIVLAGSGIRVMGWAHDDPAMARRRDPLLRLVKDVGRALTWLCTGRLLYDAKIREARQAASDQAAAQARALGYTPIRGKAA